MARKPKEEEELTPLHELAVKMLSTAAKRKIKCNIEVGSDLLTTYCGYSGQRQLTVEHYGYAPGKPDPETFPSTFVFRRHNTFTNECDKGTDGASIVVLSVEKAKRVEVKPEDLVLDSVTIKFYDKVL